MSREASLTGREAPAPEPREVRAGDLTALFVDGDLRYVRCGTTWIAQRIYVAVRDLDWNTLPSEYQDLDVTADDRSFAIRYTRRDRSKLIDYRWHADITGSRDGIITFRMHGEALAGFPYAKIGICVHHPIAGFAGQPFSGTTPSGPVSGKLPETIGPQVHLDDGTDLPLFEPVSELELRHCSGGTVRFEFSGDLWEMEDQRNWTDASYKSVSTPASLGYCHEARPGQAFDQSVILGTTGFPAEGVAPGGASGRPPADGYSRVTVSDRGMAAELELGPPAGPSVPPIGLGCSEPATPLSPRGLAALRAVAPAHLRIDINAESATAEGDLRRAADLSAQLGCSLELAVFVPQGVTSARSGTLGPLGKAMARYRALLARVLAFSYQEESSSAMTVDAGRAAFGAAPPPVIAGSNVYFNELNRHRLVPPGADGLAWSVNPQVHAFDDLSLMENLQAQPDTVVTARSFAPDAQLFVTPITLRPRFNAVATTGEEFSADGLPGRVDPRQPSLLAAAWTLGSVTALAGAGADGLTYFDTIGPRGVVESEKGSAFPALFRSQPDATYPLAIVLADVCGIRDARILEVSGADSARLAVLAVRSGKDTVVLLGNLTRYTQRVRVRVGDGARGRLRQLDEWTCGQAGADPAGFLRSGTGWAADAGRAALTLNPYGVVRLDVHHV
jgi:D-apionolactonase